MMSEAVWRRVLEETVGNGIKRLSFTGAQGEPLLNSHAGDFIWDALRAGLNRVEINTNCTTLSDRNVEMLADAARTGRFHIQASFAGYDKESYEQVYVGADFGPTSRKLRALYDAMVKVGRTDRMVINGCILDGSDPKRHRDYLAAIGIDPRLAIYREVDNFAGIAPTRRNLGAAPRLRLCWVLVGQLIVYDDGRVSACACRDSEGVMEIGDIMRDGFLMMRNSPQFQWMLESFMRREIGGLPLCSKCDMPYERRS
jgi:hypothetical protein